ncbi:MAG: OprO/OprP family phosphate-selective porin [Paraprevotella sp.]|nr:OprO/OprP family phosphate-selective porin [Paraprevotella sp.]
MAMEWLAEAGHAEEYKGKWWQEIKQNTTFGGYVIGKAAFNDQDLDSKNESHSTFDIRLVRAYVNGQVWDFKYGLQMEMNGVSGGSTEKGPHVLDAWAEWCKFSYLSVKQGQFKRCFTFENPMNPWDIGFGSYSQTTLMLAGMNDRVGEHACNGRDIGLQIQGDLWPSKTDGHAWLHYQLGVYNGQGVNHADRNDNKDIIGGLWVSPVKDLCIGAFGWTGEYSKDNNGQKITVNRNRMAFGVKYESRWTVRGEYVTSEGHKVSDYQVTSDGTTTVSGSDKADGWYATVGVPVTSRCKIYGKWDVYRDQKNSSSQKSIYNVSVNYSFYKNLKIQALYGFVTDKTYVGDQYYNTGEIQLYWRF